MSALQAVDPNRAIIFGACESHRGQRTSISEVGGAIPNSLSLR